MTCESELIWKTISFIATSHIQQHVFWVYFLRIGVRHSLCLAIHPTAQSHRTSSVRLLERFRILCGGPGQQTHQKDVQQPLKKGADQHDDQKAPSVRRQLPQENFQLRPGLTL